MQIFKDFFSNIREYSYRIVLAIIFILLVYYKISFFFHPPVPYGYDPGLYREIHYVWTTIIDSGFDRSQWPRRLEHEPLWWFFSAIIGKLGISIDIQLTIVRSIISCIPWCILSYYITKRTNLTRWLIWWIFYFLSVIQREATVMIYYKQLIALSLWLFVLLCYESKYIWQCGFLIICMIWLHRHTSLFFVSIIVIDIVYTFITTKQYNIKMITILGISMLVWLSFYFPLFHKLILSYTQQLTSTIWWVGHQWMFFTREEFLQYDFLTILWWVCYIVYNIVQKNKKDTIFWGVSIWIIWLIFWLLNANRQQILLDPFLIIATTLCMYNFYIHQNNKILILLVLFFTVQWSFWIWYITETKSLLSQQIFSDIKEIGLLTHDDDIILIDDSQYTTRIMWYTMRDWISPWLSDYNKWNYEQRISRRNANETKKCELLERYTKLWRKVWYRSTHPIKEQDDCFSRPIILSKSYLYNIMKSEKR